jgi:hypothetical protein
MDFKKFNNLVDLDGIKKDAAEAADNTFDNEEVPYGKYEVKLEKLELVACKSDKNRGMPMVSAWFRIIRGDQKNRLIFLNQLVNQGFQIHIIKELLLDMDSGVDVDFVDYEQFGNMLMDILEASSETGFVLDYSENKKGYKAYKIEEVFDL